MSVYYVHVKSQLYLILKLPPTPTTKLHHRSNFYFNTPSFELLIRSAILHQYTKSRSHQTNPLYSITPFTTRFPAILRPQILTSTTPVLHKITSCMTDYHHLPPFATFYHLDYITIDIVNTNSGAFKTKDNNQIAY